MALAETVLRHVYKLGIFAKVFQMLPRMSFLLALASVVWLLVLPMDGQYRHTYISENALLPGQVTSYFRESEWNYVRGFRSEVLLWDFELVSRQNDVLEDWLHDFGWTVSRYRDHKTNATTMYALMHAPRGDNTEAMVLAVPYYTSSGEPNHGGLTLAPALAHYFARMSIWSKNIILVFPRDGHAPLRSWVEAYHTTLDATAGSIEAALVIAYPSASDEFSRIEVSYEGLNGQLPNLDLINTVTTVAGHEGINVGVHHPSDAQLTKNDYWTRLRVLAWGVLRLATTGLFLNSLGCEAFSGWQIQAITITAVPGKNHDVTQFGRIVDSTFRSVNNLLEKFHQSFFFYLLLSPHHFVSIGTYLPAAVLVAASFVLSSLYSLASGVTTPQFISHISDTLFLFTAIEAVCLVTALSLQHLVVAGHGDVTIITAFVVAVSALFSVCALRSRTLNWLGSTHSHMLLSFALYFVAILITSMLIVHFALAFSIGLCALPCIFIQPLINQTHANPALAGRNNLKIALCLLLSCPVTALVALGYTMNGGGVDGVLALSRGFFMSWDIMQSWTYFVVTLGWLPAWLAVVVSCLFGTFLPKPAKDE